MEKLLVLQLKIQICSARLDLYFYDIKTWFKAFWDMFSKVCMRPWIRRYPFLWIFAPIWLHFFHRSPWLVMSENPNLVSRKELSDLYLYIYAYQICFDLMIRTHSTFFCRSVKKLTSSWALNWIWHEIRMLVEFFDKKIWGYPNSPFFFVPVQSGRVNSPGFGG